LVVGTHSITAAYGGDSNFSSFTSAALTETVEDFSLTIAPSSTTSATVSPGGTASYALKIGPSSGSTCPGAVTLTVSGLPAGATATLTPSTLPAGSGLTNVALTIQVPAQTASLSRGDLLAFKLSSPFKLSSMMLGMLLLPFGGRIRRAAGKRGRSACPLLLAVAGVSLIGLVGCASKTSGFFGSPQTSYTLTVTATSGALSHSTN